MDFVLCPDSSICKLILVIHIHVLSDSHMVHLHIDLMLLNLSIRLFFTFLRLVVSHFLSLSIQKAFERTAPPGFVLDEP